MQRKGVHGMGMMLTFKSKLAAGIGHVYFTSLNFCKLIVAERQHRRRQNQASGRSDNPDTHARSPALTAS